MSVGISCYDVTVGNYIGGSGNSVYDVTTASSYSRPSLSGYTYLGWVCGGSHQQCISYYNNNGVESSSTICSGYSDGEVAMFFYRSNSSGGGGTTYQYRCYDKTNGRYITNATTTTSSSITRPDLSSSGYTYQGYVYHNSFSACISQSGYDSTSTTCSQHSSNNPYVVFFYTPSSGGGGGGTPTTTYRYKCYDRTNGSYITSEQTTTSSSITRPDLSSLGYTYQGYVYHQSYSQCLNQSTYDGTSTTCSNHSSNHPYIVFFYTYTPSVSSWQTPTLMATVGSSTTSYSTSSTIYKYQAGYVKYTTPSYPGKLVLQTTLGSNSYDYYSYLSTSTLSAGSGTNRGNAVSSGYLTSNDDKTSGVYDTLISYACSASTVYYWYVNAAFASSGTYSVPWSLNYYRRYSIAYNANGGSGVPSTQYFYADNTTVTISSTTPSRTGYTFLGWSTSSSATSPSYSAGSSYALSSQNYTLYAVWQRNSYSITYNANGGSGGPTSQTFYGDALNVTISSSTPSRTGYTFLGWSTSSSASSASYSAGSSYTLSAQNYTLYAVWSLNSYTITYNANGGSGAPSTQTFYGNNTTVTISSTQPTRTGHTFLGWSTSSSATSPSYSAGGSYKLSLQNYTLYAVWEKITVTLTYNANGGSGAPTASTVDIGSNVSISTTIPTRTNYIFKGWSLTNTDKQPQLKVGDSITLNSNTTIYAVWWPAFSWVNKNYEEANTLNNYISTYIMNTNNADLTSGSIYKMAWFNNLAQILGLTLLSKSTIITNEQMEELKNAYYNY